jgi:hypothetical protein
MNIRLVITLALVCVATLAQAQQKSSALGKPRFPKLEYVNVSTELGLATGMLRGFGARVDDAARTADASQLAAQAVLLSFAEETTGKKAASVTALRVLEEAARIAEEQHNADAARIVAAAAQRIPGSEKVASTLKEGMELVASMRGDGAFTGFVRVINKCDRVLDVYIDGKYMGFLYGGDESTYSTGNGTTMGRVTDAFGNTISETVTVRQDETFVWTITP